MELFTKAQNAKLLKNGSPEHTGKDHFPVVKLFTPDANCTWLITEIDPEEPELAFGLCDLGLGYPELGYISLEEIRSLRGLLGLPVERDLHFEAKFPLSTYTTVARAKAEISDDEKALQQASQARPSI
jgi:hypothetical protein